MASEAAHSNWRDLIDSALSCWSDHLELISRLSADRFPDCTALNELLPPGLRHPGRPPVRFISSEEHAPGPYEPRIYEEGLVSTRPESWHDLFNALTWALLPRSKLAINAAHCRVDTQDADSGRGALRDALTLFDECGVILACTDRRWLERLARHQWQDCLPGRIDFFHQQVTLIVAGHAQLEKFLAPYPSMTANTLLVHIDPETQALPRQQRLTRLDQWLAAEITGGAVLSRPACLSPLPLAGIPGWWPDLRQDEAFYADRSIFRSMRKGKGPAPVHALGPVP